MTHPLTELIAKYIHHEILDHEKWPEPECTQCMDAANGLLTAAREAGWVMINSEPTKSQLLTLGLLSAAGPQTREHYIEAYKVLLSAAEEEMKNGVVTHYE